MDEGAIAKLVGRQSVGPTTVYATMQYLGVVNGHLAWWRVVERERNALERPR